MPKFLVKRDTIDSATGRIYKAGEVWEFDPPMVIERDLRGDPVMGPDGKPKAAPMKIGSNLELMPADKSDKKTA